MDIKKFHEYLDEIIDVAYEIDTFCGISDKVFKKAKELKIALLKDFKDKKTEEFKRKMSLKKIPNKSDKDNLNEVKRLLFITGKIMHRQPGEDIIDKCIEFIKKEN